MLFIMGCYVGCGCGVGVWWGGGGGGGVIYLLVNFKGKYEAIFIVQIIFFSLPHETF